MVLWCEGRSRLCVFVRLIFPEGGGGVNVSCCCTSSSGVGSFCSWLGWVMTWGVCGQCCDGEFDLRVCVASRVRGVTPLASRVRELQHKCTITVAASKQARCHTFTLKTNTSPNTPDITGLKRHRANLHTPAQAITHACLPSSPPCCEASSAALFVTSSASCSGSDCQRSC